MPVEKHHFRDIIFPFGWTEYIKNIVVFFRREQGSRKAIVCFVYCPTFDKISFKGILEYLSAIPTSAEQIIYKPWEVLMHYNFSKLLEKNSNAVDTVNESICNYCQGTNFTKFTENDREFTIFKVNNTDKFRFYLVHYINFLEKEYNILDFFSMTSAAHSKFEVAYIYVIEMRGSEVAIKIGFTGDLKRRFRENRKSADVYFKNIETFEYKYAQAFRKPYSVEQQIHSYFADRSKGFGSVEWYALDADAVIKYIKNLIDTRLAEVVGDRVY